MPLPQCRTLENEIAKSDQCFTSLQFSLFGLCSPNHLWMNDNYFCHHSFHFLGADDPLTKELVNFPQKVADLTNEDLSTRNLVLFLSQFVTVMSCGILTHFLPSRRTGSLTSLTSVSDDWI